MHFCISMILQDNVATSTSTCFQRVSLVCAFVCFLPCVTPVSFNSIVHCVNAFWWNRIDQRKKETETDRDG